MTEASQWVKWDFAKWRGDPGLRVCSLAARGLWADLLAIMHGCHPYGHLVINGRPPTNRQIVAMIGVGTPLKVGKLLTELEQNGVFSRAKVGENEDVIFSRKMVRDHAECRKNRANGRLGGNPNLTKPDDVVNPPAKKPVKAESESESESEKKEREVASASGGVNPQGPVAALPPPKPDPKGTRLAADWHPGEEGVEFAKKQGLNPAVTLASFRDYWHGKPGKDGRKIDWPGTWRNWCRRDKNARPTLFESPRNADIWNQF